LLPHNTVWETVDKGAPVKILLPEPVGITSLYAFLPKFGKNPNAAKLFVSWLTTRNGALVLEKASGRGNLLVPETRLATLLAGKRLSWEDPLKVMDNSDQMNALGERYGKMLQGR
jgi:ABC-type Fe3+ transport system substrate-binding protein